MVATASDPGRCTARAAERLLIPGAAGFSLPTSLVRGELARTGPAARQGGREFGERAVLMLPGPDPVWSLAITATPGEPASDLFRVMPRR